MYKLSNIQSAWPVIHQKLQGKFPGQLPNVGDVKFDAGVNSSEPKALGYVSTEDTNNDGKIDTIHIQYQQLEKTLADSGVTAQDIANISNLDDSKLEVILKSFVEILAHEQAHIKDYKHDAEKPFPGGESVAEQAQRGAASQFKMSKLVRVLRAAQKFDSIGEADQAQRLDKIASDIIKTLK